MASQRRSNSGDHSATSSSRQRTRVLLIEDDAAQARLIEHLLRRSPRLFHVEWADCLQAGIDQLQTNEYDVIVVDLGLPDSVGLATFDAVREAAPFVPALVMTGTDSEELATEAVRRGAQDYIVKGHHSGPMIARSLHYAIERARLEDQLRQSQKMEAVGSLAGGIAHEFNNLLQAIIGYTNYAMEGLATEDQRYSDLQKALKAADRAATLTRQLLDFSRPQEPTKLEADINEVIVELGQLMEPLLDGDIEFRIDLNAGRRVAAEPAMLLQALMNLCINARDAMPDGGTLTIETRHVHLAEAIDKALPGDYVRVAVCDTGCGIDAEIQERVLEPFFTTKPPGKGTGLGLAMVYTILQQHCGFIQIESEVGCGTTIALHFPVLRHSVPDDEPVGCALTRSFQSC